MKKFFISCVCAVLSLIPALSHGQTITLNVNADKSDVVTVTIGDETFTAASGLNTYTVDLVDGSQTCTIGTAGGYYVQNISLAKGADAEYTDVDFTTSGITTTLDASCDGYTYNVVTDNNSGAALLTVKIDDASNVAALSIGGKQRTIVNGTNYLHAKKSDVFSMVPQNPIYQTILNDEYINTGHQSFYFTIVDGDVLQVVMAWPDEDFSVKFILPEGVTTDCFNFVQVNYENVTNYMDADFKVHAGDKIYASGNTIDYKYASPGFTVVSGTTKTTYSKECTFIVEGETTVTVDCTPYGTLDIGVNIDNPENVEVKRQVNNNDYEVLDLAAGDNQVTLKGKFPKIYISPKSEKLIKSITVNGTEKMSNAIGNNSISVSAGDAVCITSGAIVRDKKALVYVDGMPNSHYFQRADQTDISTEWHAGYNEMQFCETDNNFTSFFNGAVNLAYQNDTQLSKKAYLSIYTVTIADGDVIKLYTLSEPSLYNVTFTGAVEKLTSVKKDIVNEVADVTAGFSALTGTQVDITADGNVVVKLNEEAIDPVDGIYTFNVTADSNVEIIDDSILDVISHINADADSHIYDLQGRQHTGFLRGVNIVVKDGKAIKVLK